MPSILVNTAAINTLQSIRATRAAIGKTQKEISTGQKIASAADNPSTWATAASMKSDRAVLSMISDSLSLANSVIDVASNAVKNTIAVMNDIKAGLVQAMQPDADQAKILANLTQLGKQLTSIVTSSTFAGVNVLDTSQNNPLQFVASYANGDGADSKVGYIQLPLSTLVDKLGGHFGILEAAQAASLTTPTDFTALISADLSQSQIGDTLTNADKALGDLTSYASILGVTKTRIIRQNEFIQLMGEALTTGVSSLVDVEMNEASTRLRALRAQQQLELQSLSMANRNAQMILALFR